MMTFRFCRTAAALGGILLFASLAPSQTLGSAPASPYGGQTVEEIIARVNDRVITSADYDRAQRDLDQEGRQRGLSMQEISDQHKDLLRNLIDQQLWLSKGKELGITGETELITRLDEIRKQNNLGSLDDLQKAAEQQGVSYEDFKANIRNQIVTQDVMRQEVGSRIQITPGEAQQYFEQHKQDYAQPESVELSEILISTDAPADAQGAAQTDEQLAAAAQAKADEIEAKLKAGGDFAQLARAASAGTTAAQGGDLGAYKRGQLAKVFEDQVFTLPVGGVTSPIRTKQGFAIFRVNKHDAGGAPDFNVVASQVEQDYFMSRMEPALRDYLTSMRDDSFIQIKQGYNDSGASPNKRVLPIAYSAYTPPTPKKKHKVERTRFRETTHTFRQKGKSAPADTAAAAPAAEAPPAPEPAKKKNAKETLAQQKPGRKEKIRFGRAPQETLPNSPASQTEDAGAVTQTASNADQPENPLEAAPAHPKTRFQDRAREPKQPSTTSKQVQQRASMTPQGPDTAESADRQLQSQAYGLNGDTSKKKKKKATTTGEKTRMSDRKLEPQDTTPVQPTPLPEVHGAPAPAPAPANPPAPSTTQAPQQQ